MYGNVGGAFYTKYPCTFKNCTFYGAINSCDDYCGRGSAIGLNLNEENQVTVFENCTFYNNKVISGNVGSTNVGGAIAIDFHANNCSVKFKDCKFENNYSNTGLASHIWACANWTSTTCTNCSILFSGTNTMIGPTYKKTFDGVAKNYKNEAIYVNGVILEGTLY